MTHLRRLALAGTAVLALLSTGASANVCVAYQCVETGTGPGVSVASDDGVLCVYIKLDGPPSDYQPDDLPTDPVVRTPISAVPQPYVFVRTKAWGGTYAHRKGYDWDYRDCDILPICTVSTDAAVSCEMPPLR
jgi:hypothetical protein